MNAQLQAIIDAAKKRWAADQSNGRIRVSVTLDTSSLARGGAQTLAAIRKAVSDRGLDADVGITGSWGFCWMEPCVTVRSAAGTRTVLYGNVTPDVVDEFVRQTILEGGDMPELALGVVEGNATDEIPLLSDPPFMKGQVRRLMANIGTTDPENIDHYLAHDGYAGFASGLEMDAEAIVKEMLDSGLGGRGGGGFPTGRKWDFCGTRPRSRATSSATPTRATRRLGEPHPDGGRPQLIVEDAIASLAALSTEATSTSATSIRSIERVREGVDRAYAKGLLGRTSRHRQGLRPDCVQGRRLVRLRRRDGPDRIDRRLPGDAAHQAAVPGAGGALEQALEREQRRVVRQRPDDHAQRRAVVVVRE
jgi:(2Fe-2S) ferredoxin